MCKYGKRHVSIHRIELMILLWTFFMVLCWLIMLRKVSSFVLWAVQCFGILPEGIVFSWIRSGVLSRGSSFVSQVYENF